MKASKIILLIFLCFSFKLFAEPPAWELVSMNPPRGNITCYDTSKMNIYIAGRSLFNSSNYGEDWIWLENDNSYRIISIDNDIFTIQKLLDGSGKFGVFKSSDNGKTWSNCAFSLTLNGHPWYIFKEDNKILVQLINDKNCYELYLTLDKAKSWNYKGTICNQGENYLYPFSIKNDLIITHGQLLKSIGSNIYISKDTGKTWKNTTFDSSYVVEIKIKTASEIYLLTYDGVWLSKDTCKTFKRQFLNGLMVISFEMTEDKKNIIASVANEGTMFSEDSGKTWNNSNGLETLDVNYQVSPFLLFKEKMCYMAPRQLGIFSSNDFGKTWDEINNGLSATAPLDFVINPYGVMFISHFGIFKSENEGKNFSFKGMRDYSFQCLAVNKRGYIFAGQGMYTSKGDGIFRSKDGGKTWESFFKISTGINSLIIDSQDIIYAAISAGSVIRSTNDGETWQVLNVDAGKLGINDEGHIFSFTSNRIFRSIDKGETWEEVGTAEYDPTLTEDYGKIIFNDKTKTAAYYGLVTTDNGRSWWKQDEIGTGIINTNNKYFAVDSSYNWVLAYNGGILRSTDNGNTWQKMDTSGLKHSEYCRPAVSPDGHIYVFGATGGLYRSRDRFVSVEEQMKITYNPNELLRSDIYEIELREWELYGRDNSIKIYNTLGECVLSDEFESDLIQNGGTKQVNISSLSPGVYFIRYLWAKKSFVKME